MLCGKIKPTVIKIIKPRVRYRLAGLPLMKPLTVVGYDMKYVLVADARILRVFRVLWEDIHLVESELVMQAPVVINTDNSKKSRPRREKAPFFRAGVKPDVK